MKVQVKKIRRIYGSTLHEYYKMRLLLNEIRLQDVPISMMRGESAWTLYVTAFRVDRAVSKSRYLEDLAFLKREMQQAVMFAEKYQSFYAEKLEDYQRFWGEM